MNSKIKKSLLVAAFFTGISLWIFAQSAGEIIEQVDNRQTSQSEISEMSMIVIDDVSDLDDKKEFRLESYNRSEDGQEDLSVLFFREPRRLSGMAILTRDDGQWVYFPSTGRVRLLSGAAKGGSVNGVGGDFSYEDLGSGDWGSKYEFTLIKSGSDSWELEGIPTDDEINYSRILMEVNKSDYIPRRIEFYKSGTGLEKIMTIKEVRSFDGRINPVLIEMDNPSKNSRTVIEIHKMEFDKELDDNLFHPRQFYR